MPRRKPKKKGPAKGAERDHASEGDTEETASITSSHMSEPDSIEEATLNGQDATVDETDAQELLEEKMRDNLDGTTQKSVQGRRTCLENLRTAFTRKYLLDFVSDRKMTISDCVERCLKKGKGEEQSLAANLGVLLLIQLGAGDESEEAFKTLQPLLKVTLLDKTAAVKARASCAFALGVGCFLAAEEFEVVVDTMITLEQIFSESYHKGDGTSPSHTANVTMLHCAALSSWTLLLSITPPSRVIQMVESHLPRLPDLLESEDVNLRIVAGEAIAMFYELAREDDEEFEGDDMDNLVLKLRDLATDSNKYRAKKDRRHQRSSFRDIIRTIEENDAPYEIIKFGTEELELDSWVR
ncbi:interferon-related developmental regulator 2-like [Amphiura filiformis]|uniref:interferon-related developmental regulator 2-like n=1 Tax=Amphiura filiformis TaxID=82378 RepID=UPI003B22232B